MIHYQLRCGADHGFDGWFRDSAGFDQQVGLALVACPVCGDTTINRALMAPALRKRGRAKAVREALAPETASSSTILPDAAPPASTPDRDKSALVPDHMRAMLQKLRAEVERKCDYVGPNFADEARRIHKGETPARGIYGESTPEQAEALADEGIDVAQIPWVPRADG